MSLRIAIVAAVAVSTTAFAQFRYDEVTGACRDTAGREGLNAVRGPCADLRGQDLRGVDFQGAALQGARFDGAELDGASFFRADLRGASFQGAKLTRAVLSGADLTGAKLSAAVLVGAKLEYATLSNASLQWTDLRNTYLRGAKFEQADLSGARFSTTKALLEGANFAQARFDDATQLPFDTAERARRAMVSLSVLALQ
jgi:uncharacterized protein YjbI with pentapeptide repeats